MLNAQFRPLDHWPGTRTTSRRDATFRASYPQTLDDLEYELSRIGAKGIIIQVDGLSIQEIRNDGWPRGSWNGGPGVIVSFSSPKGDISMPCDKFGDWRDNLRAIAKSLEALRMVDRYGVTRGNEQYRGWTKLQAPGAQNGKPDRETAMRVIAAMVGAKPETLIANWSTLGEAMIKRAKTLNHPDHATDEADRQRRHELFVKIGQAEAALMEEGFLT